MDLGIKINIAKMGFKSFFSPKNRMKRKRIETNLNPLFSVRHMILALDKLLPSRACFHPHTDRTSIFKKIVKKNMITNINILKVNLI